MLSNTDAWKLMTAIKHIDHRSASEDDAKLFAGIINQACNPSLDECIHAIAKWFGVHHDFGMIQPGDIADIVVKNRPSSSISEDRIGELIAEGTAGMNGAQYVLARRTLLHEINRGTPQSVAASIAFDAAERLQIAPPKPKRHKPHVHHFIGTLGDGPVTNIVGK